MKKPTPDNTFLVIGYMGTGRSREDSFKGFCIADDKGAALELMAEKVPLMNPTGASSLAEISQIAEELTKVMKGEIPSPRQDGFSVAG